MTDREHDQDEQVTRALRALYAPPAGELVWRALERRVLDAIAAERAAERAWWTPLARWSRVGALAAAVALAVAGAAVWRVREARETAALQAAMLGWNAPPAQLTAVAGRAPDREAVLRDILHP